MSAESMWGLFFLGGIAIIAAVICIDNYMETKDYDPE